MLFYRRARLRGRDAQGRLAGGQGWAERVQGTGHWRTDDKAGARLVLARGPSELARGLPGAACEGMRTWLASGRNRWDLERTAHADTGQREGDTLTASLF